MVAVTVPYGRVTMSFANGRAKLQQITITEKAFPGEDDEQFVARLLKHYGDKNGTFQIVFKNGKPDYAIVTLE
ncbi:MAG TPA: hypothetical protein PKE20_03640 [Promineifilum sp.]|nr:hypothetical protein [Promineifilum sp.]